MICAKSIVSLSWCSQRWSTMIFTNRAKGLSINQHHQWYPTRKRSSNNTAVVYNREHVIGELYIYCVLHAMEIIHLFRMLFEQTVVHFAFDLNLSNRQVYMPTLYWLCRIERRLAFWRDGHSHQLAWWRHQMETFSALLAICAGN